MTRLVSSFLAKPANDTHGQNNPAPTPHHVYDTCTFLYIDRVVYYLPQWVVTTYPIPQPFTLGDTTTCGSTWAWISNIVSRAQDGETLLRGPRMELFLMDVRFVLDRVLVGVLRYSHVETNQGILIWII